MTARTSPIHTYMAKHATHSRIDNGEYNTDPSNRLVFSTSESSSLLERLVR